MKKILVTGGGGFIGQHTLTPLTQKGYEVHAISSRHDFLWPDVIVHHYDLLNLNSHMDLIKKVQPAHLLHAAWYTENGKFWDAIENVYWLQASLSLIETFYQCGGEKVVGLGTCAEYDWQQGICKEEKTPEIPLFLYGKMKKAVYEGGCALARQYGGSFLWTRIFFPFGPGEAEKRLVPSVINALLRGESASCTHGNQIRDFLHVSDIGEALVALLSSSLTGVINLASGVPMTIREIVYKIGLMLNREDLIDFGLMQEPSHSPPKILADVERLKQSLKWTPTVSLDERLLTTIAWWRQKIK
jgi:nucleoside-diphosphate-sugar epimerase